GVPLDDTLSCIFQAAAGEARSRGGRPTATRPAGPRTGWAAARPTRTARAPVTRRGWTRSLASTAYPSPPPGWAEEVDCFPDPRHGEVLELSSAEAQPPERRVFQRNVESEARLHGPAVLGQFIHLGSHSGQHNLLPEIQRIPFVSKHPVHRPVEVSFL